MPRLPSELQELFPARDPARTLSVPLPPGRAVHGNEGEDAKPAIWVSEGPATASLWRVLRAEQGSSGLCPVILEGSSSTPSSPWDDGELRPGKMSSAGDHDPGVLLAQWWGKYTPRTDAERLRITAPFGQRWPGLADASTSSVDPDQRAGEYVESLLESRPKRRLGLVAAERGSDALAVAGWQGPLNYDNDTAKFSAVLRSWEERFGLRVVGMGYETLFCSVAGPPTDHAAALRIAAEHFAFCPDNIWQGTGSLAAYAKNLINAPRWEFWWD